MKGILTVPLLVIGSFLFIGCSTDGSTPAPKGLPDLNSKNTKRSTSNTGIPTLVKLSGDFTTTEGAQLRAKIKQIIVKKGGAVGAYIPMESSSSLSDKTSTEGVGTLTYKADFYKGKRIADFITMSSTPPTSSFARKFYVSSILDTFAETVAENIYAGDIGVVVSSGTDEVVASKKGTPKKSSSSSKKGKATSSKKGLPPIPDAPEPSSVKKKSSKKSSSKKTVRSFGGGKKISYTLPPLP